MVVVQITSSSGIGSIGKICASVSDLLTENNIENYILYSHESKGHKADIKYGFGKYYFKIQALKSRILGNNGFNSHLATMRLLRHLDRIKPDIVHLHNIHGHAVHLGMLTDYLRKHKIKVYWTFHDAWAFTGHCALFNKIGCEKWKNECDCCPQMSGYSWFFDRSKNIFNKKRKCLSNLDLTLITPSNWMKKNVEQSFLKNYPVRIIHNGINIDIFKPTESNFKKKYGIENKTVVLGVSFVWDEMKGYQDCLELAHMLADDFCLVLVGVSKEQIAVLPKNVIGIERTHSSQELAEIYSAADVLINTTYDDNYPTVNLEARACGTPVITYQTGGSPESAGEDGTVVEAGNVQQLYDALMSVIRENKTVTFKVEDISAEEKFCEYLQLYGVR